MAFFKFRWPGQKEDGDQAPVRRSRMAQAESVDDMRRRARHRLIGAAVLVALGVIGFPILFDTQPRSIPVDVPIEIPDRNQVAPLIVRGDTGVTEGEDAEGAMGTLASNAPTPLTVPKPPEPPRLVPQPAPEPEPVLTPPPQTLPVPVARVEPAPAPKPQPVTPSISEAERARALLEGRTPASTVVAAAPAAQTQAGQHTRFIVQVGAFADVSKAQEVRSKLERSGLKTYTQVVETQDGKRTRVRVGPFTQRDEADKAAARIKGLGLTASVLTL